MGDRRTAQVRIQTIFVYSVTDNTYLNQGPCSVAAILFP